MANIVLLVVLLVGGFFLVRWLRRIYLAPERKLMRDFKRLRASILANLSAADAVSAKASLDQCEEHLTALLEARKQHELLKSMRKSASQLARMSTGSNTQLDAFDARISEQLATFFATLSKISTVIGLRQEGAMESLREVHEELTLQREALVQLNFELQNPGAVYDRDVTSHKEELHEHAEHHN